MPGFNIDAIQSILGGRPAPMPGASTAAPIAAGVPQPSANYGVPQPSAANPNIASMFGPLLGGGGMNAALAAGNLTPANPALANPYSMLGRSQQMPQASSGPGAAAQPGMLPYARFLGGGGAPMIDPGMSAMGGISGMPGGSQNAAIAAAQNPMLAQAFRNQFGSLLGGRGWGGMLPAIAAGGPQLDGIGGIGDISRYAPILAGRPQGNWQTGWDGRPHLLPPGAMS